ncbi:Carbon monoxide dehydrogenase small chain [Methylobacterium crusticola]|uniref:Carbon monoxide dehydrogenase small chain n=1 Tax=Methylobacterium crusticola TaxID=1697972 RepID=A0ABQ4R4V4_9HYPH|nr:(2Fe-2S)-binding protein [Methylobacterium crusticola]GJD52160.1 Carbon monoxide dehydrogenase small chain [Methylobacterium crusticola]
MSCTSRLRCTINGVACDREIDPRLLLVEAVRDVAGLKGTRVGCLTGDCGACTVRIDGAVVKSCLVLALSVEDRAITTIEGAGDLTEIQHAFVAENGFQCGFCTTGMVLTAAELLRDNPRPSEAEIRRAISGNLCRCTGYDGIVAAVRRAAEARARA